jgi:hypothetical protein
MSLAASNFGRITHQKRVQNRSIVMLFWILLGVVIGIVALASLSDYIWEERFKRADCD